MKDTVIRSKILLAFWPLLKAVARFCCRSRRRLLFSASTAGLFTIILFIYFTPLFIMMSGAVAALFFHVLLRDMKKIRSMRPVSILAEDGAGWPYPVNEPDIFGPLFEPRFISCSRVPVMMRIKNFSSPFPHPAYTAFLALVSRNRFLETGEPGYRERFEKCVLWLEKNWLEMPVRMKKNSLSEKASGQLSPVSGTSGKNSLPEKIAGWPYLFPYREGAAELRPPWFSALANGLAISVLVRSWIDTGNEKYLSLARAGAAPFFIETEEGGFLFRKGDFLFFEEYPVSPPVHVLDGAIFAAIALYEIGKATGEMEYLELFNMFSESLERHLSLFDYRALWSRYEASGRLSTINYHRLNICLFEILFRLSGRETFKKKAIAWKSSSKRLVAGTSVIFAYWVNYAKFLIRKNRGEK